jgi:hypothetical protein
LFRNKFSFLVEGLYVSLFVGDEEGGVVDGFLADSLFGSLGRTRAGFEEYVGRQLSVGHCS